MTPNNFVDSIYISVPPREQMSHVIRLATTAVASRMGLNIDQADDISIAVDELFRGFLTREFKEPSFSVCYRILKDRLEILAENCEPFAAGTNDVTRYSRFLLESLSDRLEERPNPRGGFDVVLVKYLNQS